MKEIFRDGWQDFKSRHPRYEGVDEVIQKMLGCGDPANGYALYLCPECQEEHRVAFSCKSTFCLSCAREYGHRWVERVKAMLHPGVGYRHLTLTIPAGLRTLIYRHPEKLLAGLMEEVAPAMNEAVAKAKRKQVELGYIVVLQTAGRAATYNPHLHVLMTDGGLSESGEWQEVGYIPYKLLHQQWQEHVLLMIETRLAGDKKAMALVAEMRRRYRKGFVVHLQGDILARLAQLTRYIVKYVVSPPMALSRIVRYERAGRRVTYWYRDHLSRKRKQETVSRETFIGRLVQHILPKGFQRIRYYGLQAICKLKKVGRQLAVALKGVVQLALGMVFPRQRPSYRERMKAAFGRDPLLCRRCGTEMWLWRIWHPGYGVVYDAYERLKQEAEREYERGRWAELKRLRARDAGVGPGGYLQLPLFALSA